MSLCSSLHTHPRSQEGRASKSYPRSSTRPSCHGHSNKIGAAPPRSLDEPPGTPDLYSTLTWSPKTGYRYLHRERPRTRIVPVGTTLELCPGEPRRLKTNFYWLYIQVVFFCVFLGTPFPPSHPPRAAMKRSCVSHACISRCIARVPPQATEMPATLYSGGTPRSRLDESGKGRLEVRVVEVISQGIRGEVQRQSHRVPEVRVRLLLRLRQDLLEVLHPVNGADAVDAVDTVDAVDNGRWDREPERSPVGDRSATSLRTERCLRVCNTQPSGQQGVTLPAGQPAPACERFQLVRIGRLTAHECRRQWKKTQAFFTTLARVRAEERPA